MRRWCALAALLHSACGGLPDPSAWAAGSALPSARDTSQAAVAPGQDPTDPFSFRTFLFGGFDGEYLNDLWILDSAVSIKDFYQVVVSGPLPPPRASAAMQVVYGLGLKPYRGTPESSPESWGLLVHGGLGSEGTFDDLWVYDISINLWTEITPSVKPRQRSSHVHEVLQYTSMFIFGGTTVRGAFQFDDSWVYDGVTRVWKPALPATSETPRGRWSAASCSDGVNTVWIYGGSTIGLDSEVKPGSLLSDLWRGVVEAGPLHYTVTWTEFKPPAGGVAPAGLVGGGMLQVGDTLQLHYGLTLPAGAEDATPDQLVSSGASFSATVHVTASGEPTVVWVPIEATQWIADDIDPEITDLANSDAEPTTWQSWSHRALRLVSMHIQTPTARIATYGIVLGGTVAYCRPGMPPRRPSRYTGQEVACGDDEVQVMTNDLWLYDVGRAEWSRREAPHPVPRPRAGHCAVVVGTSMFVLLGEAGPAENSKPRTDVWEFGPLDVPVLQRTWRRRVIIGHLPSVSGAACFVKGSEIFVVGGYPVEGASFDVPLQLRRILVLGDELLEVETLEVGSGPPRRGDLIAAHVRFIGSDDIFVYGGRTSRYDVAAPLDAARLWQWSSSTVEWLSYRVPNEFGARFGMASALIASKDPAAYPSHTAWAIVGGVDSAGLLRHDVWLYHFSGQNWTEVVPPAPAAIARVQGNLVVSQTASYVLFGTNSLLAVAEEIVSFAVEPGLRVQPNRFSKSDFVVPADQMRHLDLPTSRSRASAVLFGGEIIIHGGQRGASDAHFASDVWVANVSSLGLAQPAPSCADGSVPNSAGLCVPCGAGTYFGGGACRDCPHGSHNTRRGMIGTESCAPCPNRTFSNASGQAVCQECPAENLCPPGSKVPLPLLDEGSANDFLRTAFPAREKLAPSYVTPTIEAIEYTTLGLFTFIVAASVLARRISGPTSSLYKADLFFGKKDSFHSCMSLLYFVGLFYFMCSLTVLYVAQNEADSDSMVPFFTLKQKSMEVSSRFEVELSLVGYSGQCGQGTGVWTNCSVDLADSPVQLTSGLCSGTCVNGSVPQQALCRVRPLHGGTDYRDAACDVLYVCENCNISETLASVSISVGDIHSWALSYNMTVRSEMPTEVVDGGRVSEVSARRVSSLKKVFGGWTPSVLEVSATPVYWSFRRAGRTDLSSSGYVLEHRTLQQGSQLNSYALAGQRGLRFRVDFVQQPHVLFVSRKERYTAVAFFTKAVATFAGTLGMVSILVKFTGLLLGNWVWLGRAVGWLPPTSTISPDVTTPMELAERKPNDPRFQAAAADGVGDGDGDDGGAMDVGD